MSKKLQLLKEIFWKIVQENAKKVDVHYVKVKTLYVKNIPSEKNLLLLGRSRSWLQALKYIQDGIVWNKKRKNVANKITFMKYKSSNFAVNFFYHPRFFEGQEEMKIIGTRLFTVNLVDSDLFANSGLWVCFFSPE